MSMSSLFSNSNTGITIGRHTSEPLQLSLRGGHFRSKLQFFRRALSPTFFYSSTSVILSRLIPDSTTVMPARALPQAASVMT